MAKSFQDHHEEVHNFLEKLEESAKYLKNGSKKSLAQIEQLKREIKKPEAQIQVHVPEPTQKKSPS